MPSPQPRPAGDRLAGKVALITGGASGIGRACALRFASEGASVCVADRNRDGAEEACQALRALGAPALAVGGDVTDESSTEAMVRSCIDQLGRIDVLVASAGIWSAHPPEPDPRLIDIPLADFERVLRVNLSGVLLSDRAVARAMIGAGRGGSIINMSSMMAKLPRATRGPYNVSKAGVWMLTKVLALELAPHGIRVNALAPGYIQTPFVAHLSQSTNAGEGSLEWFLAQIPLGRVGQPEDVAGAALFLASEDSAYFTGELLQPTGGWFLG